MQKSKKVVVVKPTVISVPQRAKGNKAKKNGNASKVRYGQRIIDHDLSLQRSLATTNFENFLTAPDIFGPVRFPRSGGGDKTGVYVRRIIQTISRDEDDKPFQLFYFLSNPSDIVDGTCLKFRNADGSNVNWNDDTFLGSGSVFPAIDQVADISINAVSIKLTYTGNSFSDGGEAILLTIPSRDIDSLETSNYDALFVYPGSVSVPIKQLDSTRTYLTHEAPGSYSFYGTGTNTTVVDFNLPAIAINNLEVGQTIRLECVITGEYHSSIVSNDVYPYEKSTESFSVDLDAFQDANANLGNRAADVTLNDSWLGPFMNAFGYQNLSDVVGSGLSQLGSSQVGSVLMSHATRAGSRALMSLLSSRAMPNLQQYRLTLG